MQGRFQFGQVDGVEGGGLGADLGTGFSDAAVGEQLLLAKDAHFGHDPQLEQFLLGLVVVYLREVCVGKSGALESAPVQVEEVRVFPEHVHVLDDLDSPRYQQVHILEDFPLPVQKLPFLHRHQGHLIYDVDQALALNLVEVLEFAECADLLRLGLLQVGGQHLVERLGTDA